MSKYCPEGVRYADFKQEGSKGKFHPAELGSGPNVVGSVSGGAGKTKLASGSAGATPAGVHKHSGTESFTKVVHKNASHSGPAKKAGVKATPEGVRSFGGGKAKRG